MEIKDCSCPGPAEQKHAAVTNAILIYTCARCGGGLAAVADYIHGIEQRVAQLKDDLYEQLGDVPPPGKAVIEVCAACSGRGCRNCDYAGKRLWKACPKCGDSGFDFINGHNESDGMVCRVGCGFKWAADDPRWLAQRIPSNAVLRAPF